MEVRRVLFRRSPPSSSTPSTSTKRRIRLWTTLSAPIILQSSATERMGRTEIRVRLTDGTRKIGRATWRERVTKATRAETGTKETTETREKSAKTDKG